MVLPASRRQPGRQVFHSPRLTQQLEAGLFADGDSCRNKTPRGSTTVAATGEPEARCRGCHAMTPQGCLEGSIMGPSEHAICRTRPATPPRVQLSSTYRIEEHKSTMTSSEGPSDLGGLGFFGRPLWFCDSAGSEESVASEKSGRCTARSQPEKPTVLPLSQTPLPAAVFGHVAIFLDAEDVVALASVCKSLRWIAYHRDTWRALCFSAGLVKCSPNAGVLRRQYRKRVGEKTVKCASNSKQTGPNPESRLHRNLLKQGKSSFYVDNIILNSLESNQSCLGAGNLSDADQADSSSSDSTARSRCEGRRSDPSSACEEFLWPTRCHPKFIHQRTAANTAHGAGTHCRGLQVLPGCTLHESVDWRFLFLLNRVSPGPRIYIHVRELELQFPMHPAVPDLTSACRCSTLGGPSSVDGQDCGGGEHEKQRQFKCSNRDKWLNPQDFVSTFVKRALNIRQPMRLRHLRPGNRPGLCVAEILRDQHYLLEWQVSLRYLQEPFAHSSCFAAEATGDCTCVWPLPPYGTLESDALAQLGRGWRREERRTIPNIVDDNRPRPSRQTPEVDGVQDDRLIFDVLGRESVFATLLSPLSNGTTAAAIFVGALLVAVATSSATAAITTAAAATATLAARHSRIFRVDLHVIERDEHEDDQEEVAECDIQPTRLVSGFTAQRGAVNAPSSNSGYGNHGQMGGESAPAGSGQALCVTSSVVNAAPVNGQTGEYESIHSRLGLPCFQRIFADRLRRLLRSSTLASAALTEASLALASTVFSSISRDALTTAANVLAAASAAFTSVLRPPGAARSRNSLQLGGSACVLPPEKQLPLQGAIQLTTPLGFPLDTETEGKYGGKSLEASTPAKSGGKPQRTSAPVNEFRPFKIPSELKISTQEELFNEQELRDVVRRGASEDSACHRSPSATRAQPRRSHSFLSVCIGQLGAFRRRSGCSMPARATRYPDACDSPAESESSWPLVANAETAGTGASVLRHQRHHRALSSWHSSRQASENHLSSARETEREEASSSDQEHPRSREVSATGANWTSTREFFAQNFSLPTEGWRVENPPLQPGHGLLLFVRTCLPPANGVIWPRGMQDCCGSGTEWDAAAAASWTALPEDVPLLLPADATAADLARLLFLTLADRKYMLPLISAERSGETTMSGTHLYNRGSRPQSRRRKGKGGQAAHLSRSSVLRFWLASTHPSREHHLEQQPLPSAKLTADLRLMSCERLTLTVMPFSSARRAASACTRCLTLTCDIKNFSEQKHGRRRGNSVGSQNGIGWSSWSAHQHDSADRRVPKDSSPWLLSPLFTWAQDCTLSVVMDTPADGEPTLVLHREAASEPIRRMVESSDVQAQLQPQQEEQMLTGQFQPLPDQSATENRLADGLEGSLSPDCTMLDGLQTAQPSSALSLPDENAVRSGQIAENSSTSSDCGVHLTAPADPSPQRPTGILVAELDSKPCKPWILQSSVNARQFEYHPEKRSVLLTGNNDGRVRVLDWERDAVLGTELVDSHPILGLSWLKHHPELFVCAAGVSGIPYVVRWREQDEFFSNELKGERGRMTKAAVSSSQPFPSLNAQSRQPALQQQGTEAGECEANHEEQYSADREDCLDISTVTAALTWIRSCGRGDRLSREGTASLRIVHQYCACDDLSSVSVNSTDDYLLVSGRSPDLTIHDVATGARLGALRNLHSDSINIVRFAHTSPHLFVTASFDQTCRLWDLRQRINGHQPLLTVDTGSLSVMCCFDDSDEWLLCSGVDAALRQVCLRSYTVFPQSFAIPPVNAETNFRRAVYLQGGKEFITAGTEEGFFRVFSRLGRDLGVVSLEGLLRPFIRVRSSHGLATLADLQGELLNLRIYLRSHMALGLSAMSDAALATAAGMSRSPVATVLRNALRHLSGCPIQLLDREVLERMRQAVVAPGAPWLISQEGMRNPSSLFQEAGAGSPESSIVEEYVQSLRSHPQERRLVGALLATKDQVEAANGDSSFVAMSELPATMLG